MIVHTPIIPSSLAPDVIARLHLHEATGSMKLHTGGHGAWVCVETDHPDDTEHVRSLIATEQDRRATARFWAKLTAKRRLAAKRRHYQTL